MRRASWHEQRKTHLLVTSVGQYVSPILCPCRLLVEHIMHSGEERTMHSCTLDPA